MNHFEFKSSRKVNTSSIINWTELSNSSLMSIIPQQIKLLKAFQICIVNHKKSLPTQIELIKVFLKKLTN